jgi:hypothetical protein
MVRNLPITSIGVQCWFNRLSLCLQQVAMTRLTETVALPRRAKTEAARKGVSGDDPIRLCAVCQLASREGVLKSSPLNQ